MRYRDESGTRHVRLYLLALVSAALLALAAAVPVFAAEEPAGEDDGTVQTQVVGGTTVPDGKYKFMAALRDTTQGNTVYQQQFCGGTLIDRNSVLTAAHCLEGVRARQLRVTVGLTTLRKGEGQTRPVEKIFRHPRYTNVLGTSPRYDAAVLTLSRPVRNITPARIPAVTANGLEAEGRQATVAGWGSTVRQPADDSEGNAPNLPVRMREAQVPIVSDETATEAYSSLRYVPPIMLAAGRDGKDTCQGDSGGPIFVKKGDRRISQIGITSFGDGCAERDFPGVYAETNSQAIRSFIYRAAGRR